MTENRTDKKQQQQQQDSISSNEISIFWAQELCKKLWGPMPYGGAPIRLSIHHNGPLKWCSAYIRSRHFRSRHSRVNNYDDYDHHSTRGTYS